MHFYTARIGTLLDCFQEAKIVFMMLLDSGVPPIITCFTLWMSMFNIL
jgi:hypothetical protein